MLSASQVRAARAILNWSQDELAERAFISSTTIKKIELGYISPRGTTMDAIVLALQSEGIEFLDPDGVRRRPSGIFVFDGHGGGKDFVEDMKQTITKTGGNIYLVTPTGAAFAKYCGLSEVLDLDNLLKINSTTLIRCILTDENEPMLSSPRFQFRGISKKYVDPVPFCVYGEKYAIAVPNGEPFSKLVTVESSKMATSAQKHFMSLWEKATPIATISPRPARISAS